MKPYFTILLVTVLSACSIQQVPAQLSVDIRYNHGDYLDLQAVATAFSQSRNLRDFEQMLNDNRYRLSNLDLNNDGFIDYLRVEQYSEYEEHVIEVQAVLGRNYYQTVATLYIWRDRFGNEQIQIVGHESIYGRNFIIEPVFHRRPVIVRWLWDFRSPRYVSPYYWGYYPRYYKHRHIVALPSYHHHMKRYVDHRHHYQRIEHSKRPVTRDNRGNVYRGNESRPNSGGYNEVNRKQHDQRPSVDNRNQRKPEVINRNERQNDSREQVDSRKKEENKRGVNRREDQNKKEINREQIRDNRPEPSKSAPAPARSSDNSSRRSSENRSENGSGRR